MAVGVERGGSGQFDVEVDGQVVASRGGHVLTRLIGGGWPRSQDVVAAIRRLSTQRAE